MGQSQGSAETADHRQESQERSLLTANPSLLRDAPCPPEDIGLPETVSLGPPSKSKADIAGLEEQPGHTQRSHQALQTALPLNMDTVEFPTDEEEDVPALKAQTAPALGSRNKGPSNVCPRNTVCVTPGCLPDRWCQQEMFAKAEEDEQIVKLEYAKPADFLMLRHVDEMLTPNGGIYSGQIGLDGRPHGEGAQTYVDGALYTGQWEEGAAHGEGQLLLLTGKEYYGSWQAGLKHGAGRETYDGGIEYNGNFAKGHRHGHGKLTLGNGSKFEGDFAEGEFHGEGCLHWPDGRTYAGQWQYGLMHGFGKFDWPDGKSHSGHYEEDRRQGAGVFHWPDGSLCKGRWQNGKLHGSGTYVDAEGNSRHGRWEHGERKYWT
mmetsp:Transcript_158499/g.279815  ORF Transcript_158499/g.279815 Transcript_158499/m.279815 type:complete len:376 (-) Transcript_158499:62-1189(-)